MYDLASLNAEAAVSRAVALRDEIDAMRPLDADQFGKAMQRLRLEWTYHSNAIEGNSLTYGETRALLLHGVTAQGKPLKDHLDIKGHREALDYLERFVQAEEPLTLTAIREMHKILLGEPYEMQAKTPEGQATTRVIIPGEFKTQPNHVVTATGEPHYYARPEETPALMQDLVDWARETWPQISDSPEAAIPFAADLHHRFAAIHPFDDGNGRIARLLMNLVLMRAGYPPAVLRQENRPAYYGALAQADGDDLGRLVRFVAEELADTLDLYLRTLRGEPDPDAFSRRVALLKRQVETSLIPEIEISQRLKVLSLAVLVPMLTRIEDGLQQIEELFAGRDNWSTYRSRDGSDESFDVGFPDALLGGKWSGFTFSTVLRGYVELPGESISVSIQGVAGRSSLVLKSHALIPKQLDYPYSDLPPASEGENLAQQVLAYLVAQVERLHQQAQDE